MQIVLKEIREARYWLKLIVKVGLFPESSFPSCAVNPMSW
jgi:hypothetical protein